MDDKHHISGWSGAAKALGCSPSKLRRLVADGPLDVPKDAKGVRQFAPAVVAQLRDALEHGWPNTPGAQATAAAQTEAEPHALASVQAQASAAQAPAAARTPGALAAQAFRMLGDGARSTELVKELEIPPADAMALFAAWREGKVADIGAEELRATLDLHRDLEEWGWNCENVVQAYQAVHEATELFDDAGFTSDAALALLRVIQGRGVDFAEAREALEQLPSLEEQEQLARQAQAIAAGAQHRAQEARQELGQARADLRVLVPCLGWLRLGAALAALVKGRGGAVADLRRALALLPAEGVADQVLAQVDPAHEAEARRMLAAWAVVELPELVVLRAEHEAELQQARQSRSMDDMLTGVMLARM